MQNITADEAIGNRIRVRRVALGLSQEQVARKLGISFQQVQKYERGANRIAPGRLLMLSQILKLPIGSFFEDSAVEPTDDASDVVQAMRLPDTIALNKAFNRIHVLAVRHKIVALLEAIAR